MTAQTLRLLSQAVAVEKQAARLAVDDPMRVQDLGYALELRKRAGQHQSVAEDTQAHVVAEAEAGR